MPADDPAAGGWTAEVRERLDELIDGYRAALHDCLDGLTEEEARLRLVPSKTTLLGLVKHVTFVEGVWFDQAVSGRTYAEIGIASTVDGSFSLQRTDTIASAQAAHRRRDEDSRRTMAELDLDARVDGRGDRPVYALHSRSSVSSPNTPATPTSCGSRSSPDGDVEPAQPRWLTIWLTVMAMSSAPRIAQSC